MSKANYIIRGVEDKGEGFLLKRNLLGWYATISKIIAVSFSIFFSLHKVFWIDL